MTSASDKRSSFIRRLIVLVIACLAVWYVVSTNLRNQYNYPRLITTQMVVCRLNEVIKPDRIATRLGKKLQEETFLMLDWDWDAAMANLVKVRENSEAKESRDGWGNRYYGIFDFNNDDLVPNPDPDAKQLFLKRRTAIFSAGPDGDPATWQDNIKNW
ncbi:MAG: hypothetical protein IPK22_17830 [Verrucomicrobiaceae bacterium]|nr:hypothetical protein [Verrucomicrobiaceae bacterium]